MSTPPDYLERVYAGVLGKIIGVYLGRPFEGWRHDRISHELGEIVYYVHEQLGKRLIVTDDDISGTFTFLRALPDHGNRRDIAPAQIGETWLNYLIEEKTILWWGGLGNSTEHTAYLRLKQGFEAPMSGSKALNGTVVAEQIGAQIFIDGWAMVAPGDPELAADLARRAGSVSHDGEALYGAQVLAAMEAAAFVEADLDRLLDVAVSLIPDDSIIFRMINDIREWREQTPDWREARERLAATYGYDTYGGNCHMIPNHGLIILSLLYGDDDFQRTLMIVNTCGWDTDCNSGNVGCLMGIKNGLAGIESGPDWRGPVADRIYLPTADGGRAITDAVREAVAIANIGRALAQEAPVAPKNGARFHFELPGSVQGFRVDDHVESRDTLTIENVPGHSEAGARSLALRYHHLAQGRIARITTPTFIPPEALADSHYQLICSPTLYPGQEVQARVSADAENRTSVACRLTIGIYGANDELERVAGPAVTLAAGEEHTFAWQIDDCGGFPVADVGLELLSEQRTCGSIYLDYLTWRGEPTLTLGAPSMGGSLWQRAWVNGLDYTRCPWGPEPYRLIQNRGRGLLIQGTREWADYEVSADVTPHMVEAAGIAARVQGMRRYYALLLCRDGYVRLVKAMEGSDAILAEQMYEWSFDDTHQLTLQCQATSLHAWVDDELIFEVADRDEPLLAGAFALVCEEGRTATRTVHVRPAERRVA